MTTIFSDFLTCAVCHEVSEFRVMGSTSTFGSYDLDLRAPPLKRHTMGVWLQDCPECGYINYSVEELIPGAPEVVRSPEFQDLRQDRVTPELVLSFKRHALLVSADPIEAGWALLHSAWIYDDLKQGGRATECREGCADLWAGVDWPPDEQGLRNQTVLVDVLRRAEHFDEADALVERLVGHPALTQDIARVLRFQKLLISRYDADLYTCEQAFDTVPEDKSSARN
jgi:hypothetical protein